MLSTNNLAPLWDEAIASMLLIEFDEKKRPLTVKDLENLGLEHATRIGDIMETIFLLSIYGDWVYQDNEGNPQKLDQKILDDLYAHGRVTAGDLGAFSGAWQPAL